MKQKISILGCGWLGEPLAERLIELGYSIKGSTTSESKVRGLEAIGILPFIIRIEDLRLNSLEFLDSEILIVDLPSKNTEGFKKLIQHIEKSLVKKVLFISSTSVYADSNEILTEQNNLKPSPLVEIEYLFKSNPAFQTTIIRFAGLIGYNRKPGMFFPKGKKIGNPNGFVNMIHRDDCIRIIELIIEKKIWNETFNACADTHPSRREFYTKAALDIGNDIPDFEETGSPESKIISNQKLKTILGYEFQYPNLLEIK